MQYDGLLTIATGSSRRCTNWKNKRILWSDLAAKLSNVTRTQETQAEYERMPKDERDRIKDVGGFVGGSLRTNRRKADSVCERQLITLDLDNVPQDTDPWPTVTLALGCAAVLYSTHSHTPRSPRLRLVLPLSRPVSPDEYGAIARKIAEDIGIDMCDDTTYQPHRLMYWASAATDAEFRYEVEDAPWLDADEQLSRYADWHDPTQWPVSSRKANEPRRLADRQSDPTEKGGIVGAFCKVFSIDDAFNLKDEAIDYMIDRQDSQLIEPTMYRNIGALLQCERRFISKSRKQLSDMSGISTPMIAKYESGEVDIAWPVLRQFGMCVDSERLLEVCQKLKNRAERRRMMI